MLVVSERKDPAAVLPALALLPHPVRRCEPDPAALLLAGSCAVVLVDACRDVAAGKDLCARFAEAGASRVAAVLREEDLVVLDASWAVDGLFLPIPVPPRSTRACGCCATARSRPPSRAIRCAGSVSSSSTRPCSPPRCAAGRWS